jgi:hypothetical protein
MTTIDQSTFVDVRAVSGFRRSVSGGRFTAAVFGASSIFPNPRWRSRIRKPTAPRSRKLPRRPFAGSSDASWRRPSARARAAAQRRAERDGDRGERAADALRVARARSRADVARGVRVAALRGAPDAAAAADDDAIVEGRVIVARGDDAHRRARGRGVVQRVL